MTLPSAIQLATLIVVVAGAASKELELSRGFWGWFPPIVARWLPTAVAVLGALPSLFSGVTNWDGFSMGLLAAIGVGLKHAHDPLPPPAESDDVDSTPRTVRTGGSAGGGMGFHATPAILGLTTVLVCCSGGASPPPKLPELAPVLCRAALTGKLAEGDLDALCGDAGALVRITEDVVLAVERAAAAKSLGSAAGGEGGAPAISPGLPPAGAAGMHRSVPVSDGGAS